MAIVINWRLFKCDKLQLFRCKKYRNNGSIHSKFKRAVSTLNESECDTTATFSNGTKLIISSGKYARLSNSSTVASIGHTSVMVTAVCSKSSSNKSMLPLTIDYRQKSAAVGRIPTNFMRRDIGTTEYEILTSRLVDRSLRPLFPQGWNLETQLVCNTFAVDGINDPDVISINGASAALSLSDIPWNGPVGAVRVGIIDNVLKINPTRQEMQESILNLIVSATSNNYVLMLEGSANNVSPQNLKKAIKQGVKECQSIIQAITELQKKCGKKKMNFTVPEIKDVDGITECIKLNTENKIREILTNFKHDKLSRDNAISEVLVNVTDIIIEKYPETELRVIENIYYKFVKEIFRSLIFETNIRCDGRKLQELRKITCQVDLFKPLHGSALFQRGQTQVLCTVTLDSLESALKMDTVSMLISGMKEKNFFLHYEFPPYATHDVGRLGVVGRREMGHGALAEKGLRSVLPKDYPFTIRLTSEVLESNGSSSMASVCGGSLALMDAGVPISSPVAGVAMGLVTQFDDQCPTQITNYRILTDILGMEDYLGDMDFKIAGDKNSFTALQVDVKIAGVPLKIIMETIEQSQVAKKEIIEIMNRALSEPRKDHSEKMPVVEELEIPVHQRGKFLGVGGINLKKLFIKTGVHIYSKNDDIYTLFAPNELALKEAKEIIKETLQKDREPVLEFGAIYTAKIVEIRETGVMVTLYSSMTPALLVNSQLDQRKVFHPSALGLEVGQEIKVKYFGRDPVSGSMRLSRKVLQDPITVTKTLS
ncbi:PREDICTED: polyribonucleotide nucleotidyltransferase 1, mitochondrial [Polistes canadensis]|uniref:polyribonucleotide nucleotidyltransferase 1, mitochondrial n=1 Tax=Polistes canadensis TaxID=91411 RepID=UPI000718B668|nr:PREDICTED: polyribonucleotide nucleotidyltransferase 1, mitochondrial [Polistes canadensis]